MKRLGGLVFVALALAAVASSAWAADTLDRIKQKGVLVAGVWEDAPPFGFRDADSGALSGYDVDYLEAVARRVGAKLELKPVTRSDRLSALLDGDVDVVAANLTRTPTRQAVIDVTDPYVTTGQRFLAKRGTIRTLSDLEGKKVGAIVGTPSEGCARNACPGGTLVPFDDYVQAVKALQAGTIDAFSTDLAILVDLIASLPRGDYEIPDVQISQQEYVLGVRHGDAKLLAALNQAVRDLKESGEARVIFDRWFGLREERSQTAYGAVFRKAATPPRVFALVLNGVLLPQAEVAVFALDGTAVGRGKVVRVVGDEFYFDAEPAAYDLIRPGFLVTMNMTEAMSRDVVIRRLDVLKGIQSDSDAEAAKLRAQAEQEAIEKEKLQRQFDLMDKQSEINIDEERARYYQYRRYYRPSRFYRP